MKKRDILVNRLVNRMIKLNESLIGFPELVIDGLKERVVSGEINNIQLDGCIRYVRNNHKELMSEFGGVDEAVDYVIEVVGDTSLNMGDQYFPGQTTHVDGNVDDKPFMSEDDEEIPGNIVPANQTEIQKTLSSITNDFNKVNNIVNMESAKVMNMTLAELIEQPNLVRLKEKGLEKMSEDVSNRCDIYEDIIEKYYGDPQVKNISELSSKLKYLSYDLYDIAQVWYRLGGIIEEINGLYDNRKTPLLNIKRTDIALRESNGKGFDYGEKQAVSVYDVSQKELAGIFNSRKRAQLYLNGTKDSVYNSIKNKTVIKDNRFGVPITFRLATTQQRELLGDKDMLILSSTFKYADLARHNKRV